MFFLVYDYHEFSHAPDAQYTNETLVRYGYLGASPENPTLAFSLEFLEVYRQLRRVCPRFSLDALARALCHIHRVSWTYPMGTHKLMFDFRNLVNLI